LVEVVDGGVQERLNVGEGLVDVVVLGFGGGVDVILGVVADAGGAERHEACLYL
jgi:hypothetical protein